MSGKKGITFQLVTACAFFLAAQLLYADSSNVPFAKYVPAGQAPASGATGVSSNQMFLLDSGDVNFMTNATTATTVGNAGLQGAVCQPANATSYCVGNSTTPPATQDPQRMHVNKVCPAGFIPYITATISKNLQTSFTAINASTSANSVNAVCITQFWGHPNGYGYEFGFQTPIATTNGTVSSNTPVAFHWDLYCYPGSYTNPVTPGPNNWTYSSVSPSCSDTTPWLCNGTSTQCNANNYVPSGFSPDQSVIALDSGYLDLQSTSGGTSVLSGRQCPPGYSAGASIAVNKASTTALAGNGNRVWICPQNLQWNPTGGTTGYYSINPQFSTFSNNNLGSVGATYTLYCFPPGQYVQNTGIYQCNAATTWSPQPFVLDQGNFYISNTIKNNNGAEGYYQFSLNKTCPSGWTPWATYSLGFTQNGATQNGIQIWPWNGYGACTLNGSTWGLFIDVTMEGGTGGFKPGGVQLVSYIITCIPWGTAISNNGISGSPQLNGVPGDGNWTLLKNGTTAPNGGNPNIPVNIPPPSGCTWGPAP